MADTPDYSTWLTKQQTADSLNVSTKMVERWANDKRLQRVRWKRPGAGGPAVALYHPVDVERMVRERNPDAPFVMPAPVDRKPVNGAPNGTHSIAVRQPSAEQLLEAVTAAVSNVGATSQMSRTPGGVRLAERLYLTIPEAAEFTGLGVGYLRRQIVEGKLELLKGAGPRRADVLRRTELEKL